MLRNYLYTIIIDNAEQLIYNKVQDEKKNWSESWQIYNK